jgi:DNA-binding Lrp family transcriptional regulator
MNSYPALETVALDPVDKQILRALQLRPRVPFRRLAEVLDVSEQTVARRYRALVNAGVLRVVAMVEPAALGQSDWMVRVRTRPDATLDLGRALAQRRDIGWVSVVAGGAELICAVRSHTQQQRDRLLLDRLPRSGAVLDLAASVVLRRFMGGSASDWAGVQDVLTAAQVEQLVAGEPPRRQMMAMDGAPREHLDEADYALLTVLGRDGRAPIGTLARAAGLSDGRVARRLARLFEVGLVYLDVDLWAPALGHPTSAYLLLTVEPRRLEAAGTALAAHPQTPFVAAVSGRANLIASVTCRSLDELYRYVTEQIGGIDGVQAVEVSPVLQRIKQAGTLVEGDRLAAAP